MFSIFMIFSTLLAALYGGMKARKAGGTRLDMAQYAGAYGVFVFILSLAITILILRQNID